MSYFNAIQQDSKADPSNSSVVNLASGATFTGGSSQSLSYGAIEVVLKMTVGTGICSGQVYVDQGGDGINWDITDSYQYTADKSFGLTVTSVSAYYRIRVLNESAFTTSSLRLTTVLMPIAQALPRSLGTRGNLQVAVNAIEDSYGFTAHFSPSHALQVAEPYLLCGANVETSNDPSHFTPSNVGAGSSVTVGNGICAMASGTAIGGYAKYITVRSARFVIDQPLKYRGAIRVPVLVVPNTYRAWGAVILDAAVAPQNGYFFALSATGVLSFNWAHLGVITSVQSGFFNGDNSQFKVDTNLHTYEVFYTPGAAYFVVDGVVLHRVFSTTAPLTARADLPISNWSTNIAASATGATLECWGTAILRIGRAVSAPLFKYLLGVQSITVKAGSGTLSRMLYSTTNNNSTVTLYDNTAAAGTILYSMDTGPTSTQGFIDFGSIDFYVGLTVVTSGANTKITLVYD